MRPSSLRAHVVNELAPLGDVDAGIDRDDARDLLHLVLDRVLAVPAGHAGDGVRDLLHEPFIPHRGINGKSQAGFARDVPANLDVVHAGRRDAQ